MRKDKIGDLIWREGDDNSLLFVPEKLPADFSEADLHKPFVEDDLEAEGVFAKVNVACFTVYGRSKETLVPLKLFGLNFAFEEERDMDSFMDMSKSSKDVVYPTLPMRIFVAASSQRKLG